MLTRSAALSSSSKLSRELVLFSFHGNYFAFLMGHRAEFCDTSGKITGAMALNKRTVVSKIYRTLTRKIKKDTFTVILNNVACFTFVLSKIFYLDVKYNQCVTEPFLACADLSPRNTWSRCPRYVTVHSDISTILRISLVLHGNNCGRNYENRIKAILKGPFLNYNKNTIVLCLSIRLALESNFIELLNWYSASSKLY